MNSIISSIIVAAAIIASPQNPPPPAAPCHEGMHHKVEVKKHPQAPEHHGRKADKHAPKAAPQPRGNRR